MVGFLLLAPTAPAKLVAVSTSTIPAPPLPAACGGGHSESTPQVAVRPGHPDELAAIVLVDGGNVTTGGASRDGGRTWTPGVVPASTACVGGPPERVFTVNPRVALGGDGTAWHGASWAGSGGGLFRFGLEANPSPDGGSTWTRGPMPDGYGQDLVVVPHRADPGAARLVWLHHDQVPNPATYAPSGMDMRSAGVRSGETGTVDGPPAYEPPPGQLLDDPKVVRTSDGSLIALVSQASLGDLVATFNPATADDPVRFRGLALRSEDEGGSWTAPVDAGTPVFFTHVHSDSGTRFPFALSDAAAGPGQSAALAWAEPAEGDKPGRIAIQRTRDGGRTWDLPESITSPGKLLFFPAIAFGPDGTLAVFWYDDRSDRPGDQRLDVDAWGLIKRPGRRAEEVHLAGPFDLVPLRDPPEYDVDANALGVTQDVVSLRDGRFGFAYTAPATVDGVTDARFTVVEEDPAPVLTQLSVSRRRFKAGRWRLGTRVRYTLSEQAQVRFVIERRVRTRRRRVRFKPRGALTRSGSAGRNVFTFRGRIGRRRLAPGRYRMQATATDARGSESNTRSIRFVVRP